MCLTLGALAELETALDGEDMLALATRFESGRLRAADAIAILGAGLRGGGEDISDADVATMKVDGGAAGYVGIVSALLTATFAPVKAGGLSAGEPSSGGPSTHEGAGESKKKA